MHVETSGTSPAAKATFSLCKLVDAKTEVVDKVGARGAENLVVAVLMSVVVIPLVVY
jgi:hypothetical protein